MSNTVAGRTFTANGALTANARVKITAGSATTPPQVELAGAGEQHIGLTEYAVADGALVGIKLRTDPGTHIGIATEALAVGATLYGAAAGGVKDTSDGTAIGIALTAATAPNDQVEFIDFTVIGTLAAAISVADSNNNMVGGTVEAVLDELEKAAKTAQYTIIPAVMRLESGAPIAAFANGGADGYTQLANKTLALRWNDGATPTDIHAQFVLPQDYDDAQAAVLHLVGAIVKAGANEVDSPTFTVEAYFDVPGAAPGADVDCGGVSGEFLVAGTDTFQEKTLSIALGDTLAAPGVLNVVFHPTDGELGTDDFILLTPWLEVTRKNLTT